MKAQRTIKSIYFFLSIMFLVFTETVWAIPRLAVQNGVSCVTCHVNPTGSGLRNEYGSSIVSMDELSWKPLSKQPKFTGALSDHLRIGTDLRMQTYVHSDEEAQWERVSFPMQLELYGHWLITPGIQAYAAMDALGGNSEGWISKEFSSFSGYLRAGRMIPHFGWALDDHSTFVRGGNIKLKNGLNAEGMLFSPMRSTVSTLEGGLNAGDFFITASVSDGFVSGNTGSKTFTGRVEYSGMLMGNTVLAGGSAIQEDDFLLVGIFGGAAMGPFTWMGEVDLADNWVGDGTSLASFSELSYNLVQGISLTAQYDFFDEDMGYLRNALSRISAGIEFFPLPYVEIRSQVRVTKVASENESQNPELLFQLHIWY
ncbi:MAG: hypothetical protein QF923_04970 [Candidatus Marinimicrobia bacterium]|nr:hypothetical protein [Candidatus Neomarinimicrobiota bacterium]